MKHGGETTSALLISNKAFLLIFSLDDTDKHGYYHKKDTDFAVSMYNLAIIAI